MNDSSKIAGLFGTKFLLDKATLNLLQAFDYLMKMKKKRISYTRKKEVCISNVFIASLVLFSFSIFFIYKACRTMCISECTLVLFMCVLKCIIFHFHQTIVSSQYPMFDVLSFHISFVKSSVFKITLEN